MGLHPRGDGAESAAAHGGQSQHAVRRYLTRYLFTDRSGFPKMKKLSRRGSLTLGAALLGALLWPASQWWEKGLAKPTALKSAPTAAIGFRSSSLSGFCLACFTPNTTRTRKPNRSARREIPAFFRLYDHRNGQQLGESKIYDLADVGGPIRWGYRDMPRVPAAMIDIGPNAPDCARGQ